MKRRYRVLLLTGSALVILHQPVAAQEGPASGVAEGTAQAIGPDEVTPNDEIVVSGFRRSLEDAARVKRDLAIVSDGISAEDIGRFPDQNLAESLQRITGVQITRSRGEGSAVNIRGLSSDFTRTQYNGRSVGSGGGRSFEFSTLSANFISGVEVFKSTTADMIEGGLSGTVNVRTARPLDVGRSLVSASVEGVYEGNSQQLTPRASVLANFVTSDRSFGVNLGVSFEQRKYLSVQYQGFGAETGTEATRTPNLDYNLDGDFNDRYTFDHGQAVWVEPGDRRRLTLVGGFQAKPADWFEVYGDFLYTKFDDVGFRNSNQTRFTNIAAGVPGGQFGIRDVTIDTNFNDALLLGSQGFLTMLDADGVDQRGDAIDQRNRNRLGSSALGVKIGSGPLKLDVMGSYSEAKATSDLNYFTTISRGSIRYSRPDGIGAPPLVEFMRGYDPLRPANYNLLSMIFSHTESDDQNLDLRADLTYETGHSFVSKVAFGGYIGSRALSQRVFQVSPAAPLLASLSGGRLALRPGFEGATGSINASSFMKEISYPGFVSNTPDRFLIVDRNAFFALVPFDSIVAAAPAVRNKSAGYEVQEDSKALYLSADLGHRGDPLTGNIGVRYVHTDLVSVGFAPDLNSIIIEPGGTQTTIPTVTPLSVPSDYEYFLPSMNLRYQVSDQLVARVALARVLGRPSLPALTAGTRVDANTRTIVSGNPYLKPYLSNQADVSLEYYLTGGGVISAAAFYKRISNFVVSGQQIETYTGTLRTGGTQTIDFRRTLPVNAEKLTIKGVEIGAQIPFTFLGAPFDGFGVLGSFTYVDAPRVALTVGNPTVPLDGVSKYNYNVGAYFEKYGFGIRASYTYRSSYSGGQPNNFGDFAFTQAYGQLDGSISYDITDSITFKADVSNLLDTNTRVENNFGLLRNETSLGRRITGGVRVKF